MDTYEFTAELWIWDARRDDSWTFFTVPAEESADLRDLAQARPRAGFGSVRVSVTMGATTWCTSAFPAADGSYVVPVKRAVRRAEGIEAGDTVAIRLKASGPPGAVW